MIGLEYRGTRPSMVNTARQGVVETGLLPPSVGGWTPVTIGHREDLLLERGWLEPFEVVGLD